MSKIVVDTLEDRSAAETIDAAYIVHGTAKAWANVNGVTTTSIRDSLNVSSVTDGGTGETTLTLTNNFADTDYACVMSMNLVASAINTGFSQEAEDDKAHTTAGWGFSTYDNSSVATDANRISTMAMGAMA